MQNWTTIADNQTLARTQAALEANGHTVIIAENGEDAKKKVFEILPQGAEVMLMTSATLETIDVVKEINESGKYVSLKAKIAQLDKETQKKERRAIGAAPDWALGSVHAITQQGQLVIASASGSQLPAYIYGAEHVLWVAGAQKIVVNLDEAHKRLYEYVLPLENERAQKVYGMGSAINFLLTINAMPRKGRTTIILVKEALGF